MAQSETRLSAWRNKQPPRRKERIWSESSAVAGCDERLAAATSAESVWGSLGVGPVVGRRKGCCKVLTWGGVSGKSRLI